MGKVYSVKADAKVKALMTAQAAKVRAEAQAIAKSRQEALDSYAWGLQQRLRRAQIELEKAIAADADLDKPFIELVDASAEVKAWKDTIRNQVIECFKNVRHDDYVTEAFWTDCYSSEELYQDYSIVKSDPKDESEKDFTFTFDSEVRKLRKQQNSEKNHYKANLRKKLEDEIISIEKWRKEHPELFASVQDRKVSILIEAVQAERNFNKKCLTKANKKMEEIKGEEKTLPKSDFDEDLCLLAQMINAF